MRCLELFSGTGSIGRAFAALGWEVVSVDLDPKAGATHTADILSWDYTQYPPGYFAFIWGSPPCTQYSVARTAAKTPRNLELADSIVERTLQIISYFDSVWAVENPFTGMMKGRPCMAEMSPYVRVISYCSYGMEYRKWTAIWSNLFEDWQPPPRCCKASPCQHMADGSTRHPCTAEQRPKCDGPKRRFSQRELYVIPALLCHEIAEAATQRVTRERQ